MGTLTSPENKQLEMGEINIDFEHDRQDIVEKIKSLTPVLREARQKNERSLGLDSEISRTYNHMNDNMDRFLGQLFDLSKILGPLPNESEESPVQVEAATIVLAGVGK